MMFEVVIDENYGCWPLFCGLLLGGVHIFLFDKSVSVLGSGCRWKLPFWGLGVFRFLFTGLVGVGLICKYSVAPVPLGVGLILAVTGYRLGMIVKILRDGKALL